jgi:hypothetical protein
MPDLPRRRFGVSCLHCGQLLVSVDRVTSAELEELRAHVRVCRPGVLAEPGGTEEVLRHFVLRTLEPGPAGG